MIPTPLELSLGEPFEDVSFNPAGTSASSAKKAWDDAASSLARDPAVALAPLRFLAANRFGIPDPWPVEAPRFLLEALAVANATAASSPSLASDIWSLATILLGTWARWRSERHPGGTSEAREILGAVARTIREHATRAHDGCDRIKRRKLANAPFAASQLGATPVLTLACVASAPLCPPELRAVALRDVARIAGLAVDNVNNGGVGGIEGVGGGGGSIGPYPGTLTRPESSAQRLVAAFVYAASAADDPVYMTQLCASVFPAWRGYRNGTAANDSPEDAVASQTSGLLLTRAVQATAATFPDAAASLAAVARAVLRGEPIDQGVGETSLNITSLNLTPHPDDCRSAASYVAAGLQLATRRGTPPPPGRGSPDAWHRVGDVSADAIRACVELASRPASNGRCFELVDDVAEAWATEGHTNPTQGADVEARTRDVRVANSALRRWSIATSCALALVRCQASGAIPPDVEWDALDAILVGTNASSSAGAFALLASARARSDPSTTSTRVAATMRAPLAKRAPAIATLVAERVAELYALGGGFGVGWFEQNRRRFDSRVRGSSARARRRGARRFPGVQIDRPDDVAAIARRLRDAPGVSGSVSRHPWFTPRRPAPLAGRRRRRLTGARRDRRSGPAGIRQDARSEVRYPPQRRRERVGVRRFTVRATGAGDVRDALPGSRLRARRCFRRGRRVERRRRVGIPDAPAPEACAVRGAEARRGADGGADLGGADLGVAEDGAEVLAARVLPCVERCLAHGRDALVRAAHVAAVAIFRSHGRSFATTRWFPSYLNRSLEMFPHRTPAEPFVAAIGTVAMHGELGSRLPCLAAAQAAERAAALDGVGDAASTEAASSLRRLVFGLLALVDHAIVPEMRAIAEAAMMSAGANGGRGGAGRRGRRGRGRTTTWSRAGCWRVPITGGKTPSCSGRCGASRCCELAS